jgi:hypothetical protein
LPVHLHSVTDAALIEKVAGPAAPGYHELGHLPAKCFPTEIDR